MITLLSNCDHIWALAGPPPSPQSDREIFEQPLIPQVLFFLSEKMGGEGVETSENLKLEEKPEENGGGGGLKQTKNLRKMNKTSGE